MVAIVPIPRERLGRWTSNFEERHGPTRLVVRDGALVGAAADGSTFKARLPFGTAYDGQPDPAAFALAGTSPDDWGVLLVRKGGFAVARLAGERIMESKVGQRHVQGRTKAGGQSQQRFARRRDNQARQAYDAAADHAAQLLVGRALPVVVGGDRAAVEHVLTDPRLVQVDVVGPWLAVPDPKRAVLDRAVADACSIVVEVTNAADPTLAETAPIPDDGYDVD